MGGYHDGPGHRVGDAKAEEVAHQPHPGVRGESLAHAAGVGHAFPQRTGALVDHAGVEVAHLPQQAFELGIGGEHLEADRQRCKMIRTKHFRVVHQALRTRAVLFEQRLEYRGMLGGRRDTEPPSVVLRRLRGQLPPRQRSSFRALQTVAEKLRRAIGTDAGVRLPQPGANAERLRA